MTTTIPLDTFGAAVAFREEAARLRIRARAAFLLGRFADAANLAADADANDKESAAMVRQVTEAKP
jgi:hypothetical protein